MKRLGPVAFLVLASAFAGPSMGRSEVIVRTPVVTVTAGRGDVGVCIHVPCFFDLRVQRRTPAVVGPAPAFLEMAPPVAPPPPAPPVILPAAPSPVPPPPPAPSAIARPPTLAEFAASFQAAPGTYEIVLTHPLTGGPTKVSFTLPAGSPKKVRVHRRELQFDYGRHDVSLRFDRHGGVRVHSR